MPSNQERVIELIREIFADVSNREVKEKLEKDPEELLVSLLEAINMRKDDVSAMLRSTIERGSFGVLASVKRRRAEAAEKELATK